MASPPLSVALLSAILVAAVIYLIAIPDGFKLTELLGSSSSCAKKNQQLQAATDEPVDLSVFLGIMTVPSAYERRTILRLAYSLQPRPARAAVDVRFVLCTIDKEEDRILVSLEIIAHGDVLVVNCTENMNDGKTYAYFSAVPRLFAAAPYDYVGKTDDDNYYRVAALVESLRGKARRDMYHGFLLPCHWPHNQYMSGMGYIVSWDVVEWVAATPELRDDHHVWEDEDFGGWLRKGGKNKNVYNEEPRMYNYWDRDMGYEKIDCFWHAHRADAVAVHQLKDRLKWARTLYYFNATQGLRPSKLYHVDLENNIYKVY
ncbi:hypothetical protein HU200_059925 [Digitaria exilis]|uniref:Hexosyltransferase n=1 Tax=Digitaria exilis TaxID=1010633 RepID=A0A835DXZ9_9POAL|nr:hypothetical protein HU200_059925 [Digitaria exilis]